MTDLENPKATFRNLLMQRGFGEETTEVLWQWYDFTIKKGVASF
jgi:hypothetical protein